MESSEKLSEVTFLNLYFDLNTGFPPEFMLNLVQCGNDKNCVFQRFLYIK